MAFRARPLAARQERRAALVDALKAGRRAERTPLSRRAAVAKAIDYVLTRWPAFPASLPMAAWV